MNENYCFLFAFVRNTNSRTCLHFVSTSQLLLQCPPLPAALRCLDTKVPRGGAAFLHVGWHDRGRLELTRMTTKTTSLGCVPLDLQTLLSNLLQDQRGRWFFQFVVLPTSVTHHHKPKHQMAEKPHKDLSVIHTKPESCSHLAASGRRRPDLKRTLSHRYRVNWMLMGVYHTMSAGQWQRVDGGLSWRSKDPTARVVFTKVNKKLRSLSWQINKPICNTCMNCK